VGGPHAPALNERLPQLLGDAGLDPADAARASYLLVVRVFGSIALEVADAHLAGPLPPESEGSPPVSAPSR
jgi:TetR/AcrR family tetracycline transcriptional repressor